MTESNDFMALQRRERTKVAIWASVRTVFGLGIILWMYTLIPEDPNEPYWLPYLVLAGMMIFYVFLFRTQIARISRARFPGLQSVEALILTAMLFLTIFAGIYILIAARDTAAFSEPINHQAALYFTVTVFATVGFGDIVAVSDTARSVVTIQMLLGLGFLAVVVRIFTGFARKVRANRDAQSS
jgi:voltage-gated potassium channel